jgi:hypothetical protein
MSSQLKLEILRRETGEDSHLQIIRTCLLLAPKWLVCGGRGVFAGVLHTLTNQKRLGCDVTVDPHHQELGLYLGSSCLACLYGIQASQWKKLEEGAPAFCGSFLS